MTTKKYKLDEIDNRLVAVLQEDAGLSQRALGERIGLSQNAIWRGMQNLAEAGILGGIGARIDPAALGLDLTVFVLVRTRQHDAKWSARLKHRAESIPEIVEMHRVGGEWDYLLKVVTTGMAGYDRVYQALTSDLGFEAVTGIFSMETMLANRPLRAPHRD